MISAGNRQWQGSFGAARSREFAGFGQFVARAGNDDLAGAIQIGQLDSGLGADLPGGGFVEIEDGGHAALGRLASFLHEAASLPDNA